MTVCGRSQKGQNSEAYLLSWTEKGKICTPFNVFFCSAFLLRNLRLTTRGLTLTVASTSCEFIFVIIGTSPWTWI